MVFSSLNFLFIFLPMVLLLHALAPARWKNAVLLAASLLFYGWGEPVYVILMMLSIALNYVTGLQLGVRRTKPSRRAALVFGVFINLAILGFFKYYGFVAGSIGALLGIELNVRPLALPIGISFYTFQALSYIIDVYREKVRPQQSIVKFATYITMFPQLVAGPIVQYSDVTEQLEKRTLSLPAFGQGMERLIQGLAKKVILANNLGMLADAISSSAKQSVLSAWLGVIAYTLQIYFDFSGYSDMAIGMGKMLGFSFQENFNYPYAATSITDFWRRWHISLSQWFRDYVYIPLGGNRVSVGRHVINLLIVWMLTGLWHGASWNFVLWGAYYGALLILEKYVFAGLIKRMHPALARTLTLFLVALGWVLFKYTSFGEMTSALGRLFGVGAAGFADGAFLYYLRNYFVLLLAAGLCATPLVRKRMVQNMYLKPYRAVLLSVLLFVVSTAYLVYGSYNPFLYFRF